MGGSGATRRPVLEQAILALLLVVVLLQPVFIPSASLGGLRVVPADLLYAVLCLLLGAALLARKPPLRGDPAWRWLALWMAALALSAALSTEPRRSLFRLATDAYLVSMPVVAVQIARDEASLKLLVRGWIAAAAAIAALGLVTLALFFAAPDAALLHYTLNPKGTLPPGPYPRFNLSFTHPAMLGLWMSLSILILLGAARAGWVPAWSKWPLLAAMVLSAALALTPGLGGLALALGIWSWLAERRARPVRGRLALAAGAAAAAAGLVAAALTPILHPTAPFLLHLPVLGTLAPSARLMFWIDATRTFAAHPLTGRGIGTHAVSVLYQNPSGGRAVWHDAHNLVLSVAAQAGVVGVAAFAALFVHVARRVRARGFGMAGTGAVRTALALAWLQAVAWQGLVGAFEDARCLWLLLGLLLAALEAAEPAGARP